MFVVLFLIVNLIIQKYKTLGKDEGPLQKKKVKYKDRGKLKVKIFMNNYFIFSRLIKFS